MKAENTDALVRDLIEELGVPNRKGVPLHLLIAEAKAFVQQRDGDYRAAHEEELKQLRNDAHAAQDDVSMFQQQINDMRSAMGLSFLDDHKKLGMNEIRELYNKLCDFSTIQRRMEELSLKAEELHREVDFQSKSYAMLEKDHAELERTSLTAVASLKHAHMMWEAERVALESSINVWKRFAADLASGHATNKVMNVLGNELDYINTIMRRRDSFGESHPNYEELNKILAPIEKAMKEQEKMAKVREELRKKVEKREP